MPATRPRARAAAPLALPAPASPFAPDVLWHKYHALVWWALSAGVLLLPPETVQLALARMTANAPVLLQIAAGYFAFRAAVARAPKDSEPRELPPAAAHPAEASPAPSPAPPPVPPPASTRTAADDVRALQAFLASGVDAPVPRHLRHALDAACTPPVPYDPRAPKQPPPADPPPPDGEPTIYERGPNGRVAL